MKVITHETADGVIVKLEQTADANALGDVYVITSSLGGRGWAYGRGDTEAYESLHGYRPFHLLADKFLAWKKQEI